ncbi:hypothetical protein TNCV_3026201 [Trichonephila clavipes]|nr:hypothetical protein TNCV_3026201 [Trichonephila clavipes]
MSTVVLVLKRISHISGLGKVDKAMYKETGLGLIPPSSIWYLVGLVLRPGGWWWAEFRRQEPMRLGADRENRVFQC